MRRRRLLATCGTLLAATAGCLQPPGPWEAPDIDENDLRVALSGPAVATVGDRVALELTVENGMLNPGAYRDTLRRVGDGPVDPVDVDVEWVPGGETETVTIAVSPRFAGPQQYVLVEQGASHTVEVRPTSLSVGDAFRTEDDRRVALLALRSVRRPSDDRPFVLAVLSVGNRSDGPRGAPAASRFALDGTPHRSADSGNHGWIDAVTVADEGGTVEVTGAYRGGDAIAAGTTRRGWLLFPVDGSAVGRDVVVTWNRDAPETVPEVRWAATVENG